MKFCFTYKDRSKPKSGFETFQHFMIYKLVTESDSAANTLMAWVVLQRAVKPMLVWLDEYKINYVQRYIGLSTCEFRFTSKSDAMLFKLNNV